MLQRLLAASCLLLAVGCGKTGIGVTPPDLAVGPPMQKSKVDILFMLGNEPSTSQYQNALKMRFPQLIQILNGAGKPASYHLGVITPDLGIGQASINRGQCRPGGDGARLQALGSAAAPGCQPPTGGKRFLDYDQASGSVNLPAGQDFATTFGCMASVGDFGCGFQQQLESVYRALHDPIAENAGFLRDDALLVVVYLVDKDDCSAPPDSDLGDASPAAVTAYGPLSSFRCIQFGVACGDPPAPIQPVDSHGPLSMCRPLTAAEGGKLLDVQKYIDYFTRPASMGGVKADPRDVIVVQISPPPSPVSTSIGCGPGTSCAMVDPSCVSPINPVFFGDPTVRLSAVVTSVPGSLVFSSCDTDYRGALQAIAQRILTRVD